MFRRGCLLVTSLFAIIVIGGCGPKLNPLVNVPELTLPSGVNPDRRAKDAFVFLESVFDARPEQTVAELKGVQAKFSGDISGTVKRSVEALLRKKGLTLDESASVTMNLEIRQWNAQFASESPAKVECSAELGLDIIGPDRRKKIYVGTYKGFSTYEGSSFDNKQLEELLKTSMNEAVRQIAQDQRLLDLLTSY